MLTSGQSISGTCISSAASHNVNRKNKDEMHFVRCNNFLLSKNSALLCNPGGNGQMLT